MRTSHHPVREGKMACASCHNPHEGTRPKMVKADSVNELCYTCHTEKRGPFLFEHAPVREDCVTCHEPHGSNQGRMLAQKAPNLCWNCHLTGSGHFGSGDNFSTEKGVPVAPPGAPSGFPTVNSRFIERSCRTCHVKIHGSNHPSGAYFVR
jgi:DmsE family decaheme c-type cytochrome